MFRPIARLMFAASLSVLSPAYAASSTVAAETNVIDQFEVNHQLREARRRAAISGILLLGEDAAVRFWPAYDNYRQQAKQFEMRRLGLLGEASHSMNGMSQAVATNIVSAAVQLEVDQQVSKKAYFKRLRPMLDATKYFRYYQLETKLDADFTYNWTSVIPFVLTRNEAEVINAGQREEVEYRNSSIER